MSVVFSPLVSYDASTLWSLYPMMLFALGPLILGSDQLIVFFRVLKNSRVCLEKLCVVLLVLSPRLTMQSILLSWYLASIGTLKVYAQGLQRCVRGRSLSRLSHRVWTRAEHARSHCGTILPVADARERGTNPIIVSLLKFRVTDTKIYLDIFALDPSINHDVPPWFSSSGAARAPEPWTTLEL